MVALDKRLLGGEGGGVHGDGRAGHVVRPHPNAVHEVLVRRAHGDEGLVDLRCPSAQRRAGRRVCVEDDARLEGVHALHHPVVGHHALPNLNRPLSQGATPRAPVGHLQAAVVVVRIVVELGNQLAEAQQPHRRGRVEGEVGVDDELVGGHVAVRHPQVLGHVILELERREGHLLVEPHRKWQAERPNHHLRGQLPRHRLAVEHAPGHVIERMTVAHVHHRRGVHQARAVAGEREAWHHHPPDWAAVGVVFLGWPAYRRVERVNLDRKHAVIVDLDVALHIQGVDARLGERHVDHVDRRRTGKHIHYPRHKEVPNDWRPEQDSEAEEREQANDCAVGSAAKEPVRPAHAALPLLAMVLGKRRMLKVHRDGCLSSRRLAFFGRTSTITGAQTMDCALLDDGLGGLGNRRHR
mmetsp:Transcript_31241/g.100882  ORF Transcript_31241/g.100882 Transcript_31241/m.100882 type:complete len:410 (+) Transcript_31241:972-2201(+)